MFKSMLIAGAGGFVGTCLRYLTGVFAGHLYHGTFPLGTFIVNAVGCFLIGLIFGLGERTGLLSDRQALLLVTGFCGGFTTFSAFANDIWGLWTKGLWMTGILYLLLSVVIGLLCVWGGRAVIG